jgi:ribonuclease HII
VGQSPLGTFDKELRSGLGFSALLGVDEAGRGPLAGPVVAAAVLLPPGLEGFEGVRDSKTLTPRRRDELFSVIRARAAAVGVGWALREEIDRLNVLNATLLAMRRAVERARPGPGTLVVVDGNRRVPGLRRPQRVVVDGDALSLCVAAASVVAKVVRDRWMRVLDRRHPGYGFLRHKGYGTPAHLSALRRLGPSPEHRRSFSPVAEVLA